MPRSLWKGAITFGLVHIPVALYPAVKDDTIDFDWLDERTLDPVGYKRINKRTGREIAKEHVVRGIKHGDGQYVILADDEIAAAYPKTTQTIEIEAFVDPREIPLVFLERAYVLAPVARGEKVYALLRETLLDAGRVGIARVVIQTKQHLAALAPAGAALVLNTLRWGDEIRPWDEISLPPAGRKNAGFGARELKMAAQLVDEMSARWDPAKFPNNFREAIMALVDRKVRAGKVATVEPLEEAVDTETPSNVVDLTELLRQSLGRKGGATAKAAKAAKAPAVKAAKAQKPAARKTPPTERRRA
jgi:DNA end-binding protein Ku